MREAGREAPATVEVRRGEERLKIIDREMHAVLLPDGQIRRVCLLRFG